MKLNWGKGIFLAYAAFIIAVIVMVSISLIKDTDLVAPNYYDKEIKYQEEIDKIINTNILKEQVKFQIFESKIVISFPSNSPQSEIRGEINFYRPSDSRKDFKVKLETDTEFKQALDINGIDKGLWKIKIFWNMDGIDYLSTTNFVKP